ncbi:MAG TPA: helix-turn-helix transcriptional regulator [Puia sp.]|nr:helix-turn-helix transcriptional regulator [Puia sp.]
MKKVLLIIEKAGANELWGRAVFDDNLITDMAPSMESLQKKMKKLLHDFHDLSSGKIEFDIAYDLTALFTEKKYLNLSEVAQQLGINRSLMAQYAAGKKFPSPERAREIEKAIHDLGRDLLSIKIAVRGKRLARVKKKVKA